MAAARASGREGGLSGRRNRLAIHQSAAKLTAVSIALFSHSSVRLSQSRPPGLSPLLFCPVACRRCSLFAPPSIILRPIPFSLIPAAQLSLSPVNTAEQNRAEEKQRRRRTTIIASRSVQFNTSLFRDGNETIGIVTNIVVPNILPVEKITRERIE